MGSRLERPTAGPAAERCSPSSNSQQLPAAARQLTCRLMVTLGVALMFFRLANKLTHAGGVDGLPASPSAPSWVRPGDMFGRAGYIYSVVMLFVLFWLAPKRCIRPSARPARRIHERAAHAPPLGVAVQSPPGQDPAPSARPMPAWPGHWRRPTSSSHARRAELFQRSADCS